MPKAAGKKDGRSSAGRYIHPQNQPAQHRHWARLAMATTNGNDGAVRKMKKEVETVDETRGRRRKQRS